MGEQTVRGSDINVAGGKLPVTLHDTVDLKAATLAANCVFTAFHRYEIVFLGVSVREAPDADAVLLLGVVGDTDEFLATGFDILTTDGGVMIDLTPQLEDKYLEVGEIVNVISDGAGTSAGIADVVMVLQPV